jgi:hypothetical protein
MLMHQASRRLFSTATKMVNDAPTIKTQYLMQMARVRVHLPQEGDCWFFIRPDETAATFRDEVDKEDALVNMVQLFEEVKRQDGKAAVRKAVSDSAHLFPML